MSEFKNNKKYDDSPLDIQMKVPLLKVVLYILLTLTVFLIAADIKNHTPLARMVLHSLFFILMLAALSGIQRGKYILVSNIFFPLMELAMFLMQISRSYSGAESFIQFSFILGSFLVFSAVFITNRSLLIGLCAAYFLSYGGYILLKAVPGSRALGEPLPIENLAYSLIAVISVSTGLVAFRLIFDKVVGNTVKAMEESRQKEKWALKLNQSSAAQMAKAEDLLSDAGETSAATHVIEDNIHKIDDRFGLLNERVGSAMTALERVEKSASIMTELSREQSSRVDESGAAIEQMVASINNVSTVISTRAAGVNLLTDKARSGEARVLETKEAFGKVLHLLEGIRDLARVISDIADRTNLLAMNASIQAAHAGEAGRGFSVVAGEVRTLSESTSQSAATISGNLNDLLAAFSQASGSMDLTQEAFGDIFREIEQFAKAIGEVGRNASELETGSRDILKSTGELRQIASRVDEQSLEVNNAQISINESIGSISTLAAEISEETREITLGTVKISTSMKEIHALADELVQSSRDLNREMEISS